LTFQNSFCYHYARSGIAVSIIEKVNKEIEVKQCLKIRIFGTVQGVGYREFIKKKASKLKVEGTIQNEHDKSVTVFVCGLSEDLDKIIDALYQGIPQSKVEDIKVEPLINKKDFRGVFRIIGN
jgi:acylphosphatase